MPEEVGRFKRKFLKPFPLNITYVDRLSRKSFIVVLLFVEKKGAMDFWPRKNEGNPFFALKAEVRFL